MKKLKFINKFLSGSSLPGLMTVMWLCAATLPLPAFTPQQSWLLHEYRHAINDPLGRQKSQVYEIYGEYAVRSLNVHVASVRYMINTGVKKASGKEDLGRAWRYFIHDDDVIALAFSHYASRMGTNRDLAAAMLQSLYKAGFKAENIMLIGLDELPKEAEGTIAFKYGWQQEGIQIGSDTVYLAAWLDDVTAIINVPAFMDDNIIGLRASLANLSLSVIKSPARFYQYMSPYGMYDNRGDPFVPEIYALPQIRGKVRLHIANSLRVLYHGGPDITNTIVDHKTLSFSVDPVALDRVALSLINNYRRDKNLLVVTDEKIQAPYLATAQAIGLGYNDLNFIQFHRKIRHEK